MIRTIYLVGYIFCISFVLAPFAMAYVDPGTGSFLFQLVIAGLLGSLFYIKTIVKGLTAKIKNLFGGQKSEIEIKSDEPK